MTVHAMDLAPISHYGETPEPRHPRVIVGYDGSPASRSALRYAAARAGRDGRVIVIHACGPGRWWFGAPSYERPDRDYRRSGESLVADVAERIPPSVTFEAALMEGPAPKALADAAGEHQANEIVVGVHGSDPPKRGLGSVPLALLADPKVPIVVVPAEASESDERRG